MNSVANRGQTRRTVIATNMADRTTPVRISTDEQGAFCQYFTPGKYEIEVCACFSCQMYMNV